VRFAERLVASDDEAGPFVAAGDELEEQVGGFGLEGDVAELVDDRERVAGQAGELGLELSRGVGSGEPVDPLPVRVNQLAPQPLEEAAARGLTWPSQRFAASDCGGREISGRDLTERRWPSSAVRVPKRGAARAVPMRR
jgi:hypothetical protein